MQELDLHDIWFQPEGATYHTARVTMNLLRGHEYEIFQKFISHDIVPILKA